jgi:hypothetical protein
MTPPAVPGGAWTTTLIYSFKGPPDDGGAPVGNLAIGADGALYGATPSGGTYDEGTVFQLTPPASQGDAWTLTLLYSFRGDGDGVFPQAGVVVGANGAIYGTTLQRGAQGFGTLYGLQLVAGAWEEKVLASMTSNTTGPYGLAHGNNGVLFGQCYSGIFRATPPEAEGGAWTVQRIGGTAGSFYLTVGGSGGIYWATHQGGTSTACGNPSGCGALYEMIPPGTPSGAWTQVTLHSFTGQHGDGYQPNGGLVVTKDGAVYGTTYYGGANFFGTAFRYRP